MELLKLYDENHNYIETKDRTYAHSDDCKLFHDCIHIIILSKSNKILLQKRSRFKKQHPNLWDLSVTGHVTSDDELLTACQRETFEEIGLKTKISDFERLVVIKDYGDKEFLNIYLLKERVDENYKFTFEDEEVSEIKFFDLEQFKQMFFSQEFSPYYKEYKEILLDYVEKVMSPKN